MPHASPSSATAGIVERLARLCYHRRRATLLVWLVVVVGAQAAASAADTRYASNFELPSSESQRAEALLRSRFPAEAGAVSFVPFRASTSVRAPAVRRQIEQLFGAIRALPHVTAASSPYGDGLALVASDGRTAFGTVRFDVPAMELPVSVASRLVELVEAANRPGLQVEVGGHAIQQATTRQSFREGIGLLAAVVILLVTFGSVIAAGLPIMVAVGALGVGLGLVRLLAGVMDVADVTEQLSLMIGLGVGIDYALLVVTRYRQELAAGREPEDAVARAAATAGRSVVFAGSTVVISVLGMFLMGLPLVRGIALGAAIVVLLTMLAALTLVPAVLGYAGRSIERFRIVRRPGSRAGRRAGPARSAQQGAWYRWSRVVQRRPGWAAAAALVALVVVALPALSMRLGVADEGRDPTSLTTRRAYDLIAAGFGPGLNGPLVIAAELPGGARATSNRAALTDIATAVSRTPGVRLTLPPDTNAAGDAAVITVIPDSAPQDAATTALVHRLRNEVLPRAARGTGIRTSVGGITAVFVDLSDRLGARLPLVIGAVVGFSFLVLMIVFRSLLVPLKAAAMNLLSVAAAYGVIVAVFQWGWLADLVGIDRTGPIESYLPPMLFAVLFGLSMDYEVFLLSRVREQYTRTGDNALAVADGLAATARVITAAAAIMVVVFASFVAGDNRVIKLAGVGLATAILLDATLVRLVLVPATMELLGDANWWFPRWLDRRVPHLSVDDRPPRRRRGGQ